MIIDKLENGKLYAAMNPRFEKAFDFLTSHDLTALEAGKIELDGKNLVVNVNDFKGKAEADCRIECHDDFIDIQLPVNDDEDMGWAARADLREQTEAKPEKDVIFYADKAKMRLHIPAGHFAIFFPHDGHQPGIAPGREYRKIIVKVKA